MSLFWSSFLSCCLVTPVVFGCTLPKGQELTIGCTFDCDPSYRLRLQFTAWKLGYDVNIIAMPEFKDVDQALRSVHGILAPGGADIDPQTYLAKLPIELQAETKRNSHLANVSEETKARDPFEYHLLSTYSADDRYKNLPLLGICRGMQMMTVTQGIPLYLDLKTQVGVENRSYTFDTVRFQKSENQVSRIYASDEVSAFKLHHQGLDVSYWSRHRPEFPLVKVTAFSHAGKIAEVIEFQHRPAIGVQFHPEKSFPSASEPILTWLLTKSCEYRNSPKDVI